jgi:Spy/CpxP family protein refolding chaperone
MHPAFYHWWKHARRHHDVHAHPGCGPWPHGSPQAGPSGPEEFFGGGPPFGGPFGGGGPFGVRRPLRFLAHKLDLRDDQVAELARVLDELKTERAQGEVDQRRTVSAFADAIEGDAFDDKKAAEGADLRTKSAERLREAVVKALSRIHAILDADQRKRLAYLIRTGVVTL